MLANVPAEDLSFERQEAIRTCVHDQGCGLVMIGGPDAFGAGGWQDTPVEKALPVDCEIKSLKVQGKGGLVLIMHACEMADGNMWQKKIAKLAIERLGPNDMVGVMQYGFGNGAGVTGSSRFRRSATKNRMLGASRQDDARRHAGLRPVPQGRASTRSSSPKYDLATKHVILISDGDPQYGPAGRTCCEEDADNNVTCTTVGVATHSNAEGTKLKSIAAGTKDGKGQPGSYYEPKDPAKLPAIYIKESRRISQSFIYDKPFTPQSSVPRRPDGRPADIALPTLYGFVRTTLKPSPLVEMPIEGAANVRSASSRSWRTGSTAWARRWRSPATPARSRRRRSPAGTRNGRNRKCTEVLGAGASTGRCGPRRRAKMTDDDRVSRRQSAYPG